MKVTLQEMKERGVDELDRPYWRIRGPSKETGKRVTRDQGRWTPAEALEKLEDERALVRLGLVRDDGQTRCWSVSDVVDAVIEEIGERWGDDTPHVISETRRLVHLKAVLGSLPAESITTQQLERYAARRRRDPCRTGAPTARRSIVEEIAAWGRAVRILKGLRKITFDPPGFPALKAIPDDGRPQRRLTEAEVAALLRSADVEGGEALWSMLTVLAWSGRRPVAVFAVTRHDCRRVLDDELGREERLMYWTRDKAGVGRGWGPLADPAYHAIRARAVSASLAGGLLWRTRQENEWTAVRLNRVFERIATRAGVDDVQPYDLRRYAVTRILDGLGGNARKTQLFTGHRTVASVFRYAFAAQGEAESAAPSIGWSVPKLEEAKKEG